MAKPFITQGDCSMGYIHCCGALHKTRTFHLVPQENFLLCELDFLSKCPVCGHTVVQLTRIDEADNISVVRKINKKARICRKRRYCCCSCQRLRNSEKIFPWERTLPSPARKRNNGAYNTRQRRAARESYRVNQILSVIIRSESFYLRR